MVSGILQNWKKGLGFPGIPVIDGHIHVGAWRHAPTFYSVAEAIKESRAYLEANGADAFCAMGGGYLTHSGADYRLGNDFLLAIWRGLKDRMVPFLGINPNDTRANIIAELERMRRAGVRCIKLINDYQENYPGDGPNLMALYEYADKHRMPVFNHAWSKEVIWKIARKFPRTDFIFGHYGGGWQDEVLRERKNVYTNIWNLGPMGWLQRGVEKVGAHKFMYGSDGFLNALSVGLGPVVFADIPDEDKNKILGLNVAKLLNKAGALPAAIKKKYKI